MTLSMDLKASWVPRHDRPYENRTVDEILLLIKFRTARLQDLYADEPKNVGAISAHEWGILDLEQELELRS